jgi:hypothetical protein
MKLMQHGFPSKKQIELELAILNTPTYQEAREVFVGYVRKLQEARSATDIRLLQRELVLDVNGRQKALAEVVAEHRPVAKARIEELLKVDPKPKEELRAQQAILRGVEHAKEVADALQHATRVLADGMVWRTLDYDRPTISILGKEPPVARHADDVGFMAELAAIDYVEAEDGLLTFHNDTTNILRRGDITSVLMHEGRPFPLPREVKAGNADGAKQVERIQEALGMIQSRRFVVPVPFETDIAVLGELIAESKSTGYATAKLDCRFVSAIDYRHFAGREQRIEEIVGAAHAELGWNTGGRLILAGMNNVSRIRDRGNPVVELAPVSIFPLPPDDVADLLLGFVDTSVHLHTELLGLRFAERGMRAGFTVAPASHTHFLEARRGYRGFLMPAYVREQMLHELMTVETLTTLADWILASGKTREWVDIGKAPILGFESESSVWSPGFPLELAA